jgi:transcriptional regulator with XRE-family HTH domain
MTATINGLVLTWTRGDRLRKSLEVAGIGVIEMAEYLDVSRHTVGGWINERHQPSSATLRAWSNRCGVPFEWLRDGETPAEKSTGVCPMCAARDSNPEPADYWLRFSPSTTQPPVRGDFGLAR